MGLSREMTQLLRELLLQCGSELWPYLPLFFFNWPLGRRKQEKAEGGKVKGEFYQREELIFCGVLGSTPQPSWAPLHTHPPTHASGKTKI